MMAAGKTGSQGNPMKVLVYIAAVVYPLLVFLFLAVLKMPLRLFSLFVMLIGAVYFLAATSKKKSPGSPFWDLSFFWEPACCALPPIVRSF
jgi:hypothetical protein